MKNISAILDRVIQQVETCGADLQRLNEDDLSRIKECLNNQPYVLWVDFHEQMQPYYINDIGKAFYGFKSNDLSQFGFDLYKKILPQDNIFKLKSFITFFNKNNRQTRQKALLVKLKDGFKWVYTASRGLIFKPNGQPKYVISIIFDVDDLTGLTLKNKKDYYDPTFVNANKHLYSLLTKREKEVLHLIAEDKSNAEVAHQLGIKIGTVKTHRKKIIRKLNVNSAVGLVKYALFFQ